MMGEKKKSKIKKQKTPKQNKKKKKVDGQSICSDFVLNSLTKISLKGHWNA